MKCLPFIIFLLPFVSTFSLHYDPETRTYNDLLISISPDFEGCTHSVEKKIVNCLRLEAQSEAIIRNLKTWITEVRYL